MTQFLVNPWLFWGGLIAIASPIIIHLLNKRRFKRVDWAAMDFLLQALKINRRRVKLEDFLLLLMRCILMILIGLLLARPFVALYSGAGLFGTARYERVIILDDSLSMEARDGGTTPLAEARKLLTDWLTELASSDSGDTFTLILTSSPERAVFRGIPLDDESVNTILEDLGKLESSDVARNFSQSLSQIETVLEGESTTNLNRIVYVISDFRARDWDSGGEQEASETLKRIADSASGCYLVDLGEAVSGNLAVESIIPREKALIAGVPSGFDVTVRNLGEEIASDVKVRFSAGDTLPLEATIDSIPAGGSGTVPFTYTFTGEGSQPEPVRIQAEILADDALAADDQRYFPARVSSGLEVLIVDGDPALETGFSESFYLSKALAPRGPAISGITVTIVDEIDFEGVNLSDYQVVYLSNLYRVSSERLETLESWVESGGGLALSLGGQVDEESYNVEMFREGEGLLPAELLGVDGDETEESWVNFNPQDTSHPVLRLFEGENNPLLEGVKIFRWWNIRIPEAALTEGRTRVLATYTRADQAPALVESSFGEGRVVLITTPLDADWNNWPMEAASYLITQQELTRYLARSKAEEGVLAVAEPLSYALDLVSYQPEGTVETPDGEMIPVRALPDPSLDTDKIWKLNFEETRSRGFYEINLNRTSDGEVTPILYAANLDVSESDLARADQSKLLSNLDTSRVEMIAKGQALTGFGANQSKSEFWRWILYGLITFLCLELLYAWWLGARR